MDRRCPSHPTCGQDTDPAPETILRTEESTVTQSLKIVAADDESAIRDYYQELLPKLGHQVVLAQSGEQLVALCQAIQPDLIIADIKMGEKDGLDAVDEINRLREVPVILVSAHHTEDLQKRSLQGHVMAYLVKPARGVDLANAINLAVIRFRHYCALRQEASDLRQALEDRKVVERAKGSAMHRLQIDEQEAFTRMRKLASNNNVKLVEIARRIVGAEETFQQLDRI